MTIIKKSSKGTGIIVVDDFGNMYITSLNFLMGMINGKSRFILMKRLGSTSNEKFMPSPMFDATGKVDPRTLEATAPPLVGAGGVPVKRGSEQDVFSRKHIDKVEQVKNYTDKVVWNEEDEL